MEPTRKNPHIHHTTQYYKDANDVRQKNGAPHPPQPRQQGSTEVARTLLKRLGHFSNIIAQRVLGRLGRAQCAAAFKSGGRPRKRCEPHSWQSLCAPTTFIFYPLVPLPSLSDPPSNAFFVHPRGQRKKPEVSNKNKNTHTHTHGVIPSNRNTQHQKTIQKK